MPFDNPATKKIRRNSSIAELLNFGFSFIDFKFLSGYATKVKETFYSENVNLFSKLRLEYAEMFSTKENYGYFSSKGQICGSGYNYNSREYKIVMEKYKKTMRIRD